MLMLQSSVCPWLVLGHTEVAPAPQHSQTAPVLPSLKDRLQALILQFFRQVLGREPLGFLACLEAS